MKTKAKILEDLNESGGMFFRDPMMKDKEVFSYCGTIDDENGEPYVFYHVAEKGHFIGKLEDFIPGGDGKLVKIYKDDIPEYQLVPPDRVIQMPRGELLDRIDQNREFMTRDEAIDQLGIPTPENNP